MRKLSCREAAGFDCDYVFMAEDDDEVIQKAKEHGAQMHGLAKLSPELEQKLRGSIKSM